MLHPANLGALCLPSWAASPPRSSAPLEFAPNLHLATHPRRPSPHTPTTVLPLRSGPPGSAILAWTAARRHSPPSRRSATARDSGRGPASPTLHPAPYLTARGSGRPPLPAHRASPPCARANVSPFCGRQFRAVWSVTAPRLPPQGMLGVVGGGPELAAQRPGSGELISRKEPGVLRTRISACPRCTVEETEAQVHQKVGS